MDKQKVISDIYYDKSGYGSKAITLKDDRQKDETITMSDVNEFFKNTVEEKRKMRGQNSFVAPHAFWEFQLDLLFIAKNDLENQKFRTGIILIDIFRKYASVRPIASKQPPDVLAGIMEGVSKMGGKPKMIYSDEEGSLFSSTITDYLDEEKFELHTARGHPAFGERFIRTFKDMLFKRVDADEKKSKNNIQWIDYILEILITYNNKLVSSVTKMTPLEARKKKNEFEVKLNISMNARKTVCILI